MFWQPETPNKLEIDILKENGVWEIQGGPKKRLCIGIPLPSICIKYQHTHYSKICKFIIRKLALQMQDK